MVLSKAQVQALEQIEKITKHFGESRWFVQAELARITYHSIKALIDKGHLEAQEFEGMNYYRLKKQMKQ